MTIPADPIVLDSSVLVAYERMKTPGGLLDARDAVPDRRVAHSACSTAGARPLADDRLPRVRLTTCCTATPTWCSSCPSPPSPLSTSARPAPHYAGKNSRSHTSYGAPPGTMTTPPPDGRWPPTGRTGTPAPASPSSRCRPHCVGATTTGSSGASVPEKVPAGREEANAISSARRRHDAGQPVVLGSGAALPPL